MDILLTSQSGQFSGMEIRLIDEARILKQIGHTPQVATNSFPENIYIASKCKEMDVPYFVFDPARFIEIWRWRHLNKFRALMTARRFWRNTRPDLCNVLMPWTEQGLTRLWLASRFNIHTVLSVHQTFPDGEFAPWLERHAREACASLQAVYAVSYSALQAFESTYQDILPSSVDLRVINNFVDDRRFAPSKGIRRRTRDTLDIPQDALVIGSVGRLASQKRSESIVELFAKLRRRFPNLYLILAGQGPLEDAVLRLADSLGVTAHMRLVGFVEGIQDIYAALDLHVLLSRTEGLNLSTIEAMANGVPVIGTDVPGTRDILRGSRGGFLVPLADEAAAFEAASRILLDKDLRKSMGAEGREEAHCRFGKDRWASEIMAFYADVFERISRDRCP